ncbi:hypothetical protein BS47DRAFT_1369899 [Hydnum rufescens UP504]|uniref:ParB-like nuclease n=1 Tax=Hydnum rufescens UP504 TaxID=1448309 RepID=A0A9P6DL69_9AGAM|nr:hypothetical protein BS47DRAFT_1369899 [Hydnum rufescens UP504]
MTCSWLLLLWMGVLTVLVEISDISGPVEMSSTTKPSEFEEFMLKFSNKAFLGRFSIPLRQMKVFAELQRPLVPDHVTQLVQRFKANGMNHTLPVNTIKVLVKSGAQRLNPGFLVPAGTVFEVWSGQHRVAAAKKYLREEMSAALSPVDTLAVDAELSHERAYWFADVYDRSFYEENPELFQSFIVAENVVAQGTLGPSFHDVWRAMRTVFQKTDLTPKDRQLHYKNLAAQDWEGMERVLSCEPLCEVLDELLKIPAYYSKPGKMRGAFAVWGTRGSRKLMAIILRQALDQMRALLPAGGHLEDLTDDVMTIPYAEWSRIGTNANVIIRLQAAGIVDNDIPGLQSHVMKMPRHRHTLSLEALRDGLSSEDSVAMKHSRELLTPKFVLTATGAIYTQTVQGWVDTIFVCFRAMGPVRKMATPWELAYLLPRNQTGFFGAKLARKTQY